MPKYRFELVDEPQPDAITLALVSRDGRRYGRITCPAGLSRGRPRKEVTSGEIGDAEAFRSAIRLGNEIVAPVVVHDPQGLWKPEWGRLYREAEG